MRMLPALYSVVPKVEEAVCTILNNQGEKPNEHLLLRWQMRHGGGVPYEAYGHDLVCGLERLNGPSFKALLPRKWLPSIPGLVEKLQAGILVADIGCGSGLASIVMAKRKYLAFRDSKTNLIPC